MDTKGSFYTFWAKTAKHRSPGSVTRDMWGFQGFMLQKHNCMQIMQRFKTAAQLRSVLKKTLKRMSCRGWQCLWACVYELLHLQHAGISEIPEGGML